MFGCFEKITITCHQCLCQRVWERYFPPPKKDNNYGYHYFIENQKKNKNKNTDYNKEILFFDNTFCCCCYCWSCLDYSNKKKTKNLILMSILYTIVMYTGIAVFSEKEKEISNNKLKVDDNSNNNRKIKMQ